MLAISERHRPYNLKDVYTANVSAVITDDGAAIDGVQAVALGGVVALSVEYRTRDQEVVGSSLGRARGVKTLGMFLTPMCSPSSTSWYRPKGGDALRLGSKGRYGLCVGGR